MGGNISYRPHVLHEAIGDSIARITDTYDCAVEGVGVLFVNYHPKLFVCLGGELHQWGNFTSVCALCLGCKEGRQSLINVCQLSIP